MNNIYFIYLDSYYFNFITIWKQHFTTQLSFYLFCKSFLGN